MARRPTLAAVTPTWGRPRAKFPMLNATAKMATTTTNTLGARSARSSRSVDRSACVMGASSVVCALSAMSFPPLSLPFSHVGQNRLDAGLHWELPESPSAQTASTAMANVRRHACRQTT